MSDEELERCGDDFWADTGLGSVYPRAIEQAIALKLPVTVVKLPDVTVRTVGRWLLQHQRTPVLPAYRRNLMGCLYADRGHGIIFVCGADEPEEQRFTLAHDTAHFLVDYWWPRLRVIEALGPPITEVLDGRRAARPSERAAAILARVRVGSHWHLLPRPGTGPRGAVRIACIEDRADDLGLELVAPRRAALRRLHALPSEERADLGAACRALGRYFGLPPYVFGPLVAGERPPAPSFLDEALRLLGR